MLDDTPYPDFSLPQIQVAVVRAVEVSVAEAPGVVEAAVRGNA